MRVDASPWVRARLTPAAMAELRAAPDQYRLSITRGRSGFGATLTERTQRQIRLVADVHGHATPQLAIEAVMDAARPRPELVA